MNQAVEWIKKGVGLCVSASELSEQEKRVRYAALEEEYLGFPSETQRQIRSMMRSQFDNNDLIYVLSQFLFYMKIKDFQTDTMEAVMRGSFDCYTSAMLEVQVRVRLPEFYRERRMLHKKSIEAFRRELAPDCQSVPVEKRNKKRIAVVTEQLLSARHAPTRLALDIIYVLQKHLGYEILLFVCPSDRSAALEGLWYLPGGVRSDVAVSNEVVKMSYREMEFLGYQVSMNGSRRADYQKMFALMKEWNPLFTFCMGVFNPIGDLIGSMNTLVSMGMTLDCPVSEGDILIRFGRKAADEEQKYEMALEAHQVQLFLEGQMPAMVERGSGSCLRSDIGVPEEQFLIAIVGNRLETELDTVFVDMMQRILERTTNTAFVIIGEITAAKILFEKEIFDDRIYYLGYREDLADVYGVMDLYLNPKREGGGYSSALAIASGIPVVTLPNCDVAYNVGEEFVAEDEDAMLETVCRYAVDEAFYNKKKEQAQSRGNTDIEEQMTEYVRKMIDQISMHIGDGEVR